MAWYHRILNIARSNRVSRDIDRELAFHVAERTDDLITRGVPPAEAVRQAQRQLGNAATQRERTRAVDIAEWVQSVAGDLRYALRGLVRTPVFTVAAVASLGLGVGANTAIFTLLDTLLLRPLPVPHPEELYQVTPEGRKGGVKDVGSGVSTEGGYFTNPIWEQLRDRQTGFSHIGAFGETSFNLAEGGDARRVRGAMVGGDYFEVFQVRPAVGSLFTGREDKRGCAGIAVLGYRFWQRAYAGARDVVGQTIRLTGHPFEIVGVAPETFRGADVGREPDVYVPLCSEALIAGPRSSLDMRTRWFLRAIGRLRSGVTPQEAQLRLAAISGAAFSETLPPEYSRDGQRDYVKRSFDARLAARGFSGARVEYGQALYALMVAVALVLLIACANVANLLLSRAEARQHELAIRLAIGAERLRLVRQLLTESLVLAVIGATVGVLMAQWGAPALIGLIQRDGATNVVSLDLSLNFRLLLFATLIATATVLLFGVTPAWRATRVSAQASMKAQARGLVEGRSRWSVGKVLVTGQVALSLVLVVGAALFVGTFRNLSHVKPGFSAEGILLVDVDARPTELPAEGIGTLRRTILDRSRGITGIVNASSVDITPVSGSGWNDMVVVEGFRAKSDDEATTWFNEVGDTYFATMETRLLAGRDFNSADVPGSARVSIVNDAWARKFFGNRNPVGREYRLKIRDSVSAPYTIVGVVENAKYRSLREKSAATAYLPASQSEAPTPTTTLVLRTRGDPFTLVAAVRKSMGEVHPAITLDFSTLSSVLSESMQTERLLAVLSAAFGALAALLAMVGLYGVMAYAVARRRGELGVRIALGAGRDRVMRLVLHDVVMVVGIGVAVGSAAALAATRLVRSLLYAVQPTDAWPWLSAILLLSTSALCAGFIPAWRAAHVDPMEALREQ